VSKTINLVERDPWNVIEDWYEPDKHFVYFDNNNDLSNKIKNILGDWPSYQQMLEDSYNHSIENYTCDHLIKEIENNEL